MSRIDGTDVGNSCSPVTVNLFHGCRTTDIRLRDRIQCPEVNDKDRAVVEGERNVGDAEMDKT